MSVLKKSQVVMLATEKAENSLIKYDGKNQLIWRYKNNEFFTQEYLKEMYANSYYLYILSDDEIKEGDWAIKKGSSKIFQVKIGSRIDNCKKIIATTDNYLSRNNFDDVDRLEDIEVFLPKPSQSFIEKYIEEYNKGNIITDVLVEYEYNRLYPMIENDNLKLKTNPKDNTVTIKKVKDIWSREEVIELLYSLNRDKEGNFDCSKWIEENLK